MGNFESYSNQLVDRIGTRVVEQQRPSNPDTLTTFLGRDASGFVHTDMPFIGPNGPSGTTGNVNGNNFAYASHQDTSLLPFTHNNVMSILPYADYTGVVNFAQNTNVNFTPQGPPIRKSAPQNNTSCLCGQPPLPSGQGYSALYDPVVITHCSTCNTCGGNSGTGSCPTCSTNDWTLSDGTSVSDLIMPGRSGSPGQPTTPHVLVTTTSVSPENMAIPSDGAVHAMSEIMGEISHRVVTLEKNACNPCTSGGGSTTTYSQYQVRAGQAGSPPSTNVVDGITLNVGDKVLFFGPSASAGIYQLQSWDGVTAVYVRPSDAQNASQVPPGFQVVLKEGNTWRDTDYELKTPDVTTYTMGVTSQEWRLESPTQWKDTSGSGVCVRPKFQLTTTGIGAPTVTVADLGDSLDTVKYNLDFGSTAFCQPIVTDVQCVNGTLYVTKKWLVIPYGTGITVSNTPC